MVKIAVELIVVTGLVLFLLHIIRRVDRRLVFMNKNVNTALSMSNEAAKEASKITKQLVSAQNSIVELVQLTEERQQRLADIEQWIADNQISTTERRKLLSHETASKYKKEPRK